MIYAGKYNAPDYELILDEGCGLAIESTMIHHKSGGGRETGTVWYPGNGRTFQL